MTLEKSQPSRAFGGLYPASTMLVSGIKQIKGETSILVERIDGNRRGFEIVAILRSYR